MKAIGEVMSIGRTFKESIQKAMRFLEIGRFGFGGDGKDPDISKLSIEEIKQKLQKPNSQRLWYIRDGLEKGMSPEKINDLSKIDTWFIYQLKGNIRL